MGDAAWVVGSEELPLVKGMPGVTASVAALMPDFHTGVYLRRSLYLSLSLTLLLIESPPSLILLSLVNTSSSPSSVIYLIPLSIYFSLNTTLRYY